MVDDSYLKTLATSDSVEEFKLKMAAMSGVDLSGIMLSEYEDDYAKRIGNMHRYADEVSDDGKISFEKVIDNKLPVVIGFEEAIAENTFSKLCMLKFYDRRGKIGHINYDLALAEDMESIHGIDVKAELMNMLEYELLSYPI